MSNEGHQPTPAQEAHLKILRALHANPALSQRDLSKQLSISLGKVNYCVQALLQHGWIKTQNFKNNRNKIAHTYLLTPKGIDQKVQLTVEFLNRKQLEFDLLRHEIKQLKKETSRTNKE